MTAPHPAAAPALRALTDLAAWQPANADDLARLLQAMHDGLTGILDTQAEALANWATHAQTERWPDAEEVAGWIEQAVSYIGSASESLDRAREATGAEWPR